MTLFEALSIAIEMHAGQVDKAGEPYIGHVVRVMMRLPADATETERKAALLHDTLEDAGGYVQQVLVKMGAEPELMEMVEAMTCKAWEPYETYLLRVAQSPAWRVKLADIADNNDPDRLAKLDPALALRLASKYNRAVGIISQVRLPSA